MNHLHFNHPFTCGDYVKNKLSPERGIGKVESAGSQDIQVRWLELPGQPLESWHYCNLTLTHDRPRSAVSEVLDKLRAERARVVAERETLDAKITNIDISIDAVERIAD